MDRAEYKRTDYQKNRERYLQKRKDRYDETKSFLRDYKSNAGCKDCGNRDWRVLEFDHLRDKSFGFQRAHDHTFEKILEEIEKCEVVCANCHKIRTLERMHDRFPDLQRRTKGA